MGRWFDDVDAADVTPVDLHGVPCADERPEIWVMDTERIPVIPGVPEMILAIATRWGEGVEAISGQWRPKCFAWLEGQWIKHPADAPNRDEIFAFFAGKYGDLEKYTDEGRLEHLRGIPLGFFQSGPLYFEIAGPFWATPRPDQRTAKSDFSSGRERKVVQASCESHSDV